MSKNDNSIKSAFSIFGALLEAFGDAIKESYAITNETTRKIINPSEYNNTSRQFEQFYDSAINLSQEIVNEVIENSFKVAKEFNVFEEVRKDLFSPKRKDPFSLALNAIKKEGNKLEITAKSIKFDLQHENFATEAFEGVEKITFQPDDIEVVIESREKENVIPCCVFALPNRETNRMTLFLKFGEQMPDPDDYDVQKIISKDDWEKLKTRSALTWYAKIDTNKVTKCN